MATKIKVTYLDGREDVVVATPRAQVMTERHFAGLTDSQAVQTSYYLAWASLHFGGKDPGDFEAWLDRISDCAPEPEKDPDPTLDGPPSTSSSD